MVGLAILGGGVVLITLIIGVYNALNFFNQVKKEKGNE